MIICRRRMSSVYQVNKGIDQPVEFRGLRAQYIWWLGGGVVGLLMLFAMMYVVGVNMYVCVLVILLLGLLLFLLVYKMNRQYGEHGLMKKMATKAIPKKIRYK